MDEKYESLYPVEFAPGWHAHVAVQRNRAGAFCITELTLKAMSTESQADGLTAQTLRSIRLTELVASALEDVEQIGFELLASSQFEWADAQRKEWWQEIAGPWVLRGRQGFDHKLYAKVSFFYIRETRENPQSPLTSLASKLGIARDQLAKRIDKARQLGILDRPSAGGSFHSGRAAASLTRRGYELLGLDIESQE
jgi:hypothetical protein